MSTTRRPRNCWWSRPRPVMPQARGFSMTLVASSRPPSPTSMIAASAGERAKARKATAVVASKKLGSMPLLASRTSFSSAASWPSSISWPAIRMRSLKRTRCGLVKAWILWPAASSAARRKAQTEPLPLVPATWNTGGSASCGRPRRSSRRVIRSRPRRSPPGDNFASKSSSAWTAGSAERAKSGIYAAFFLALSLFGPR